MMQGKKDPMQILASYLKEYLRKNPEPRGTRTDYSAIIASYQRFVQQRVAFYLDQYSEENCPKLQKEFYNQFWKSFFDEVAIEANNVYAAYKSQMAEKETFWEELQNAAYEGLRLFKNGTA